MQRREPVAVSPLAVPEPQGPVGQGPVAQAGPPSAPVQLPQLPTPELPALPHGVAPPPAVIGVIGVPDIMQACTAYQQVQRVIGQRNDKLKADAQKEQAAWNTLSQSLKADAEKLSPEQLRAHAAELQGRERALQERVTTAQRQFRDRTRIIQEATQVSLGQVERTLIAVIKQVADSRGMNLVLHRGEVALNINEFDITKPVAEQLNKVLPAVQITPDGVDPAITAQTAGPGAQTVAAQAQPAPAPAAAPAAPAQPAR